MPVGQLAVEHLHGTLSVDGFVLEQVFGITDHDQVLSSLTGHGLPTVVVVAAGAQRLESKQTIHLSAGDAAVLVGEAASHGRWIARGGQRHRLTIIRWSTEAYQRMARYSNAERRGGDLPQIFAASPAVLALMQALTSPPTHLACLPVWYQAKVMEVAALALYEPVTIPAETKKETANRDRVERAKFLLERDLRNPPTLEMLAQELGCGSFQLSRLFKEHVGRTIPEFLRRLRIERASEALASTRQSVSDIVLDVGYESFSAFTRAFVREIGMTPSQYRLSLTVKNKRRKASGG